ncbi:hypothetical protein HDU89_001653 [Geranomyces variabilis]|nr:hypothetical protein HDU89_001653 [Geranomyces variabilis]
MAKAKLAKVRHMRAAKEIELATIRIHAEIDRLTQRSRVEAMSPRDRRKRFKTRSFRTSATSVAFKGQVVAGVRGTRSVIRAFCPSRFARRLENTEEASYHHVLIEDFAPHCIAWYSKETVPSL